WGDFGQRRAVLRAVRDDQVVPFVGIVAQRGRRILDYELVLGEVELEVVLAAFFLDGGQSVDNALAEGQVVAGARRHHRDAERIILRFCRWRQDRDSQGGDHDQGEK